MINAVQTLFDRLVAKYEKEMQKAGLVTPDIQMGIHSPEDVALDGISDFDGTAGIDNRPDFVRADDERIDKHGA